MLLRPSVARAGRRKKPLRRKHGIPVIELELVERIDDWQTMLELGCKGFGTYKNHWTNRGKHHISVDLNGKGGALQLDLMEPLNLGVFDVVTNFGTTEHVAEQFPVWENIHKACDGYIASVTPKPGDWSHHGRFYPTLEWYEEFALLNDYSPIIMDVKNYDPGRGAVRFLGEKRSNGEFTMPDDELMFINETGKKVGRYG